MKRYELLEIIAWSDRQLEGDSAFDYAYDNGDFSTLNVYDTLESGMAALKKCKNMVEYRPCGDGKTMIYEIFAYALQEVFYSENGDMWEGYLYYGVA